MTQAFETKFQDYTAELSNYQSKFDRYKELAEQYASEPAEFARQLGIELASPFIAHITTDGLSKIFSGAKNAAAKVARGDGLPTLDDLTTQIKSITDDLPFPDAGFITDAKSALTDKLNDLGLNSLADEVQGNVAGATGRATEALRTAGGDAQELADGLASQARAGISVGQDVAGEAVQNGVSRVSGLASQLQGSELSARGTLLAERMMEPTNVFGLRGTEDLDPEAGFFAEPPPSQATTNVIGRLFGRAPTVESEDVMSSLGGRLSGMTTNLSDSASRLFATMGENVRAVENLTGATQSVAEQALSQGATAIRGGTDIITDAAGTATDVAGGVAGGLETGAELAAEAGPETGGLSEIVAGALALGGVLASLFSRHQDEATPVQLPNLPRPSFAEGLATG